MKFFQKLRKSRKGFTLIELIVVIAILAILAAILIPAMITYINKAKEQTAKSDCRAVYSAAAAAFSTVQTSGVAITGNGTVYTKSSDSPSATSGDTKGIHAETMKLLGTSYTDTSVKIKAAEAGIVAVSYNGWTYTSANGTFTKGDLT